MDFIFVKHPPVGLFISTMSNRCICIKEDVRVRVGIKETEDPIPVCYCFGWTREKIFNQIKEQGFSTAIQEISAKVKAGECACEINNPSGRCCLGEVNKVVKKGMEIYGKNKIKEQE